MAYTTINKSTDYFDTKTWSGNNTDPTTISGLNFQPDMIWGKARSGTYGTQDHCMNDAVRGANKVLRVNQTNAEETDTNNIKSFTSDGWTMGNDGKINQASTEYVGWSWKANGAGSANTAGSISSTVSVNTISGFSIVKYTGNDTAGATVGHGLGVVPKMIIVKRYTDVRNWAVYHHSIGNTNKLYLNLTDASSGSTNWNNTTPSNTFFTVSAASDVNGGGGSSNYIAYCFAEKQGFSKFGSYTGNGNADGTFVYTGFKPAFIIWKISSAVGNWQMQDTTREPFNDGNRNASFPDTASAEAVDSAGCDFLSNGFKLRNAGTGNNDSGSTYIYMCFAEAPLVGTNGVTAKAR